jgi:hypothetical protein
LQTLTETDPLLHTKTLSLFGYLFWKQFSVSKTVKHVFGISVRVWVVVFKTKTSKTKNTKKHEIRKQV